MTVDDDGISLGSAQVVRATDRALLVHLDSDDSQLWVPKSQVHDDSDVYEDAVDACDGELIVKTWWAEQEGLA